jgi:hypothetical protein
MSFVRKVNADIKDITHYIYKDAGIDDKNNLYVIENNKVIKEIVFLNLAFDFDDLVINSAKKKSEIAKKMYGVNIPPVLYKKEIIQEELFFVKRDVDKDFFNSIQDFDERIKKMNQINEERRREVNNAFYEGEDNKHPSFFFEENKDSSRVLEQLLIDGHTMNILSSRREIATEYMRKYFLDNEIYKKYLFPREKFDVPDFVQLKIFGTAEHIKNEYLEKMNIDVFFDNTRTKFIHNLIKNYEKQKYKLYLYEPDIDINTLTPEQIDILNKEKYVDLFKLQPIERNKVITVKSMEEMYNNITAYANYTQRNYTLNRIIEIGHEKFNNKLYDDFINK